MQAARASWGGGTCPHSISLSKATFTAGAFPLWVAFLKPSRSSSHPHFQARGAGALEADVWGGDAREHSGGGGGGGPPVASTPDTAAMWLGSWPIRLREPLAQVPTFFPSVLRERSRSCRSGLSYPLWCLTRDAEGRHPGWRDSPKAQVCRLPAAAPSPMLL